MSGKELFLEHLESLERALSQMQQWVKYTKKNLLVSMKEHEEEERKEKP